MEATGCKVCYFNVVNYCSGTAQVEDLAKILEDLRKILIRSCRFGKMHVKIIQITCRILV